MKSVRFVVVFLLAFAFSTTVLGRTASPVVAEQEQLLSCVGGPDTWNGESLSPKAVVTMAVPFACDYERDKPVAFGMSFSILLVALATSATVGKLAHDWNSGPPRWGSDMLNLAAGVAAFAAVWAVWALVMYSPVMHWSTEHPNGLPVEVLAWFPGGLVFAAPAGVWLGRRARERASEYLDDYWRYRRDLGRAGVAGGGATTVGVALSTTIMVTAAIVLLVAIIFALIVALMVIAMAYVLAFIFGAIVLGGVAAAVN